jgi:ABC-type uncharacterized transport system substrate-binding protein
LKETGFIDGQNVAIAFRWAEGHEDRLAGFAADLIRHRVAVIATPGSTPAAMIAKAATTTIPIVFAIGGDPVALGLVASLNRPGGNITGITALNGELAAKRLGLARALMPKAEHFFALVNPKNRALTPPFVHDLKAAASTLGLAVEVLQASNANEIDIAFAKLPRGSSSVLLVGSDIVLFNCRTQIVSLAARHRLPTIYDNREAVKAGGLLSYGANFLDVLRRAGAYTGRILKGEKASELPVLQEAKFEMAINLKTAKALDLTIAPTLLATADEVIE